MRTVDIAGTAVPAPDDVYVIAEAGVNHNGDVDLAHRLVDVATAAGADAVKFQTFDPAKLVSSAAASTPYQQRRGGAGDQRSLLEALTLPATAWAELRDHAAEAGTTFLSTPFDLDSAAMLVELGLPALKVSSGELTNVPYLRGSPRWASLSSCPRGWATRRRWRQRWRQRRVPPASCSSTACRRIRRRWRSATCARSRPWPRVTGSRSAGPTTRPD